MSAEGKKNSPHAFRMLLLIELYLFTDAISASGVSTCRAAVQRLGVRRSRDFTWMEHEENEASFRHGSKDSL